VQGRFSPAFTADHAANELSQIWWDAHNLAVGTAVSYGFIGLILAMAFGWLSVRSARGPMAVFAAVVATTWLLEPAGLATFPLVMLCLGTAVTRAKSPAPSPEFRASRLWLMIGAMASMAYLLTDVRLHSAMDQKDPGAVAAAAAWTPWDPVAANTAAAAYANFNPDRSSLETALTWMQRARDRQPDFPFYSNKIAQLQIMLGRPDEARVSIERALDLQPWNVQSLQLRYVLAQFTNDEALLQDSKTKLCTLGSRFLQAEESCPSVAGA
jgi:hypothetical protein